MECHKGFERCSFVLVQTLRRIVFFWRRLSLMPIHMFPTFVFVANDLPVQVSNNFNNTCSAVVFHVNVLFLQNKTNQPNKQPVRPSSPRQKGLAFYISCIMAWSIGPIEVGATHKNHGVVSPLKTDMSPKMGHFKRKGSRDIR